MKRSLQVVIVIIISITLASSAQAYVDSRGFPYQGTSVSSPSPPGINPPQNIRQRHHNAPQPPNVTIINQYYPVVYDNDYGDYPNDSYRSSDIDRTTNGGWVKAINGEVPGNSLIAKYINGQAVYTCRAVTGIDYIYGYLIAGRGCYVENGVNNTYYQSYEVKVGY